MRRKFLWALVSLLVVVGVTIAYWMSPSVSETEFPAHAILHFSEPDANPPDEGPHELKIVTYNIGYASGKRNNADAIPDPQEVRDNLDSMIKALQGLHPDLLALQEVDFKSRRSFDINEMEYLAKALHLPYAAYTVTWNKKYIPWPYWPPRLHFGRMLSGQVLLSRYPILDQEVTTFEKPRANHFWYNWGYLNRCVQKISVQLGKEKAVVWLLHLEAYDPPTRLSQAKWLGEAVQNNHDKLQWAIGDFNSISAIKKNLTNTQVEKGDDHGEALQAFEKLTGFQNAEQGESFYTVPSWDPYKKIDHIFYAPAIKLEAVGTVPGLMGSDHLPVWAQFRLP